MTATRLYVNLFIPSELKLERERRQNSPGDSFAGKLLETRLTITSAAPFLNMSLHLRSLIGRVRRFGKGEWQVCRCHAKSGQITLHLQAMENGATGHMGMPMRLHIEAMPDETNNRQAILYGRACWLGN